MTTFADGATSIHSASLLYERTKVLRKPNASFQYPSKFRWKARSPGISKVKAGRTADARFSVKSAAGPIPRRAATGGTKIADRNTAISKTSATPRMGVEGCAAT